VSTLVLLRHGESEWNRRNLFTGWVDVELSDLGRKEAAEAGSLMADAGIRPELVFTSVLRRSVETAEVALAAMGLSWLPVVRHWRLNERHYGGLQGRNKKETAALHGEEQTALWRRSYDVPPPPLGPDGPGDARIDPRYRLVPPDQVPATECLADVVGRMLPYWHDSMAPFLMEDRCVLVVAHGNSIRALRKHLDEISDADISDLEIPTGIPFRYEVDPADPCRPRSGHYLGDPAEAAARAAAVAAQSSTRT